MAMGVFNIPCIDGLLEGSKRKRILMLVNDPHNSLFLVQHFLGEGGVFIQTKPMETPGEAMAIDWYSARTGIKAENEIWMPADAVQFFSALKKLETKGRIVFPFTPVLLLYDRETATALLENLCAHAEQQNIILLVIIEPLEIFESVLAEIKNFFDFLFLVEDGKITVRSVKMPKEDAVIRYIVRESSVVLLGENGRENSDVLFSSAKKLLWLPGSELLFPAGINEPAALYFSVDARTKDYLIEQCLSEALFSSRPCIFVSGETSWREFRDKIKARRGLSIEQKNFVFIDWFSWNSRKVIELEANPNEIVVSKDIVYLSVGLDWALKRAQGKGIIIFDVLSALAQNYSIEDICSFLAVQIARAKKRNCDVMSFGNPDVVGNQKTQALASLHDGHIIVNGKASFVSRSENFYHSKGKFGVAVAAGVLSIIPLVKKEEELSEEEIARVLRRLDELLGNLPDDKVLEFAQSEEFPIYERLLRKYGI